MNKWIRTELTKPSWQQAYLHTNGDQRIIWDGGSLFYALQSNLDHFCTIHIICGMYPHPISDKQVMLEKLAMRYIGNVLLGLKTGYDLGSALLMDDGK